TRPTFKRLARRGGVKRLSSFMYEESRGCLFPYVQELLRDTILHAENSYRTTVTAADVVHALRRSGRNLYGYGV
ncbi:histone Octamer, chromosomal Protein, alpha carbons only, partial [Mycena vitilis]